MNFPCGHANIATRTCITHLTSRALRKPPIPIFECEVPSLLSPSHSHDHSHLKPICVCDILHCLLSCLCCSFQPTTQSFTDQSLLLSLCLLLLPHHFGTVFQQFSVFCLCFSSFSALFQLPLPQCLGI